MKATAVKRSGNSTDDTPMFSFNIDGFHVEVSSHTEDGDAILKEMTKAVRDRWNAYKVLSDALLAIEARIQGVYDNPALKKFGPLLSDSREDILRIVRMAFEKTT